MSYFVLFMTISLVLTMAFHLRHQLHKTDSIRKDLHEARNNKVLTGLHSLRKIKD